MVDRSNVTPLHGGIPLPGDSLAHAPRGTPRRRRRVSALEATIRRLELQIQKMQADRVESPERRKLQNALHRAWQLEQLAELMASEFGVATHECVTEAACEAAERATGDIDSAYESSDAARACEAGAKAAHDAQDAARLLKALCRQELAAYATASTRHAGSTPLAAPGRDDE